MTGALVSFLALGAATGLAWRLARARRAEREAAARLPTDAAGIVVGAAAFTLAAERPRAVLVLHGFGDTPQTVTYLAAHLAAAGWAVRAPLLPGHGRSLRAFAASGADAWIDGARRELAALRARHEHVALVGVSMGGALATILAAEHPELPALALLVPYVTMSPLLRWLARTSWGWGLFVAYLRSRGERSIHDPVERARALGYGYITPRLLRELATVVARARRAAPHVRTPTLVVHSRADHRIRAARAARAFARLGAPVKRLEWTEGNGHVITVDHGREHVFALVADWLDAHVPPAAPPAASPAEAAPVVRSRAP